MKQFFTLLAATTALAACSTTLMPDRAPGASFYERQEVEIETANALSVEGPFKVQVFGTAKAPKVTLIGPPEMIADTRVEVNEGTLSIAFVQGAQWSWNTGAGMHAFVDLPTLDSVALKGSGSVELTGAKADNFEAGTGGSGSITIRGLKAQNVQVGVGGSGSVTAEGSASNGSYGVGGSGSINAKGLRVARAEIGIGGSGSISADVSETAKIGIGGSGRVDVVGGAKCTFDPAQASQIECR